MPVTLEAAKQNAVDDLDLAVINEFRTSTLLDHMVFDDAVNPIGGGGTLTYSYRRETALAEAAFRKFNEEYVPANLPPTSRHSVDLVPLGGSFEIDRVLAQVGPARSNELARNMSAKIQAAQALFAHTMINGDSAIIENSFDGLDKALSSSTTELLDGSDWSGAMNEEAAYRVMETVDALLDQLDGAPTMIVANRRVAGRIKAALRRTGQYTQTPGPLGTMRDYYGNIAVIDAGKQAGSNADIIPITGGVTDIYAVRVGLDGFHGVSMAGSPLINYWLPDFSTAGAVKRGEVEMGPVAVALKRTKAAAVARNVRLAP